MISFIQNATAFRDRLADPRVAAKIDGSVALASQPGPVVSFVGMSHRGKSTLMSEVMGIPLKNSNDFSIVAGPIWNLALTKEPWVKGQISRRADQSCGDILVCDLPGIDSVKTGETVERCISLTDLAVMTIQVTQPTGEVEMEFVKRYLCETPSILVLTKCDTADDEDLQDALEATLEAYADVSWQAILVSGTDVPQEGRLGCQNFSTWWRGNIRSVADNARRLHHGETKTQWVAEAAALLVERRRDLAAQFQPLQERLKLSEALVQVQRLQEQIAEQCRQLPQQATQYYQSRLPQLRLSVSEATDSIVEGYRQGQPPDLRSTERELEQIYREWDTETRNFVRAQMEPKVARLRAEAARFVDAVNLMVQSEPNRDISNQRRLEATGDERLVGGQANSFFTFEDARLAMTTQETVRQIAIPTISGLSSGALLLGLGSAFMAPFLALPLAALGAGAMIFGQGTAIAQANRRRIADDVQRAIQGQAMRLELKLLQQFSEEWRQFVHKAQEALTFHQEVVSRLLADATLGANSDSRALYMALATEMQQQETLGRDLRELEALKDTRE